MRKLSDVLKQQYGKRIRRLCLSSGCTCPNRDGTCGNGGCTFCSEGGSGEFASPAVDVDTQIRLAKQLLKIPEDSKGFIAYYQSFTNTYGDIDRLSALYQETIRRDDILILDLATRPDCLGEDVMNMIRKLNRIKPVWIELGLQTVHERTARRNNRGYPLPVFEESFRKLKEAGLPVIVHMIFGLPGESRTDMLESIRWLAERKPDGVKITMLQILKGTSLAEEYASHPFPLLSMEEYADLVAEAFAILPKDTVIHRMTGDPPRSLLIAPEWTLHKKRVMNAITHRISSSH